MTYEFAFPENERAIRSTIAQQCEKVMEEALEVKVANEYGEGALRVCEEAFDGIVAVENLIRKFPESVQSAACYKVMAKGVERGDWDA